MHMVLKNGGIKLDVINDNWARCMLAKLFIGIIINKCGKDIKYITQQINNSQAK